MDLIVNHSYIISFEIAGKILTYQCRVLCVDETFVTFIDKFSKILTYNKSKIISCEEVTNVGQQNF